MLFFKNNFWGFGGKVLTWNTSGMWKSGLDGSCITRGDWTFVLQYMTGDLYYR
jgi:hypothetical protein